MSENWKAVVGWDGFYEVSDLGRARSVSRTVYHKGRAAYQIEGRILRLHPAGKYLSFVISKDGTKKTTAVHRVVARAFLGPKVAGMEVDHIDGDRHNNRADNLRWVSHAENEQNKVRLNRHTAGTRNAAAILTEAEVQEIRRLYRFRSKTNDSNALGHRFGVSPSTVRLAARCKTWRHLG